MIVLVFSADNLPIMDNSATLCGENKGHIVAPERWGEKESLFRDFGGDLGLALEYIL